MAPRPSWLELATYIAVLLPLEIFGLGTNLPSSGTPHLTVESVDSIGVQELPAGLEVDGTEVGGLSGITFDPASGLYYAVSDDRSHESPARFYVMRLDAADGSFDEGDLRIDRAVTFKDARGALYGKDSLDLEGIAWSRGHLFVSSEGVDTTGAPPFVREFTVEGDEVSDVPLPPAYLPTAAARGAWGPRPNRSLESLAVTPDGERLYTAPQVALWQDGTEPTAAHGSGARLLRVALSTGSPTEFLYDVAPIPETLSGAHAADNGLSEMATLDGQGTLLALEKATAHGASDVVRVFETADREAETVADVPRLDASADGLAPMPKRLLADIGAMGLPADGLEGMTLGPTLEDGRRLLVLVSDNGFDNDTPTRLVVLGLRVRRVLGGVQVRQA